MAWVFCSGQNWQNRKGEEWLSNILSILYLLVSLKVLLELLFEFETSLYLQQITEASSPAVIESLKLAWQSPKLRDFFRINILTYSFKNLNHAPH